MMTVGVADWLCDYVDIIIDCDDEVMMIVLTLFVADCWRQGWWLCWLTDDDGVMIVSTLFAGD